VLICYIWRVILTTSCLLLARTQELISRFVTMSIMIKQIGTIIVIMWVHRFQTVFKRKLK